MKRFLLALGTASAMVVTVAQLAGAQQVAAVPPQDPAPEVAPQPVVIELYTSQGCSSCPPADALMQELAGRDDVLALALHVDYWDYIGWKDTFASPRFTQRQKMYARAAGHRTIYTPQMVVGGEDHVVGNRPTEVAQLIRRHSEEARRVKLTLRREGETLDIDVVAVGTVKLPPEMVLQLVRYLPEQTVSIERGENAGRTIDYANVVTDWRPIADWSGGAPLTLDDVPVPGPASVAVILQQAGMGPILAAATAR